MSDITYSALVPEGSILDSSVINRTSGNMRNADMMGSISSDVISRDPNLGQDILRMKMMFLNSLI